MNHSNFTYIVVLHSRNRECFFLVEAHKTPLRNRLKRYYLKKYRQNCYLQFHLIKIETKSISRLYDNSIKRLNIYIYASNIQEKLNSRFVQIFWRKISGLIWNRIRIFGRPNSDPCSRRDRVELKN